MNGAFALDSAPRSKMSLILKRFTLIGVYGGTKALQLVSAFAIAHTMNKNLAGTAFYLIGLIAFSQVVSALGLDNFIAYFYPRMKRRGAHYKIWPYIGLSICYSVPLSALMGIAIFADSGQRSMGENCVMLIVVALSSAASVARRIGRTVFLSESCRLRSIIHDSAINSLILIVLFYVVPVHSVTELCLLVLLSFVGAGIVTILDLRTRLPIKRPTKANILPAWRSARVLTLLAVPSLISQGAAQILNRADVLILAPLSTASEVANYSVAIRVTFILQSIVELTIFSFGPRILASANISVDRRHAFARRMLLQTTLLAVTISIPLIIFVEPLIRILFGVEYLDAAPTLQLLIIGKMMTAPFGPLLMLFVTLGANRALARILVGAAIINIGIDFALIPTYGAFGAAVASTAALSMMSVCYYWLYRTRICTPAIAGGGR